ncbi:EamA family transporter [Mucilaginibacter sp. RS28]|uniref:EamA family transporter n=1 Tax=Mucilaginibacter straminoryzae TaxID=2932774 RepID=A0A9X2BBM6_9SPHI|nr:EamA family transporter [Mucilaginibacter straminoryzae]MCJ8208443.1 EamA family transporter [Mucilaginibacter straminoryzae]
MKPKSTFIYLAAAISAAFIWGFFAIPLKHLHHYPPQQILYYRVFTSFVSLWALNLIFRRATIRKDIALLKTLPSGERKKVLLLLISTGFFITANWFTYIYVVNHIGVKVAAFAYLICPLLTACGGFMILKEPLTRVKFAGLVIAVVSIALLSTVSLYQVLWALFVAVFYAIYLVIQRVLNQFDKINMLAFQLMIAILILLPFYIHDFNDVPTSADFWFNIILIALVFTLLPLLLSLFALNGIQSSTLGITIYINPVISFTVAVFYFNETIERSHLLGYLLLLIAVMVFNWQVIANLFKKKINLQPASILF